jgi:hypothetical protein
MGPGLRPLLLSAAATAAFVLSHCLTAVQAGNSQCTDAQGVTAPCRPGNSDCNASAPPPLPRYHIIDYSCGENDPNGTEMMLLPRDRRL